MCVRDSVSSRQRLRGLLGRIMRNIVYVLYKAQLCGWWCLVTKPQPHENGLYCEHVCENCACRSSLWRKFPYDSVGAILLNLLQENDKHVSVLRIGWLFLVDTWISRTRSGNHKYRMRKILHVFCLRLNRKPDTDHKKRCLWICTVWHGWQICKNAFIDRIRIHH